jgi:hypothetical protein
MKSANYPTSPALATHPVRTSTGWLPVPAGSARALDLSHWRSRAARGLSWNRGGNCKRHAH